MPASVSVPARADWLNCGFRREPGKRRTSTSVSTPAAARVSTSSCAGRVPCPIVQIRILGLNAAAAGVSRRTIRAWRAGRNRFGRGAAGIVSGKEAIRMLETYSQEELVPLVGHEVVDANGKSVGYVDLLFVDTDSGRAEWLGVWNGVWETRPRVLVPIRGAELVEDEIRVPYASDVVE